MLWVLSVVLLWIFSPCINCLFLLCALFFINRRNDFLLTLSKETAFFPIPISFCWTNHYRFTVFFFLSSSSECKCIWISFEALIRCSQWVEYISRDACCVELHWTFCLWLRFIQAISLFNQPKMTGTGTLNDSFCNSHDSNTITSDALRWEMCVVVYTQPSFWALNVVVVVDASRASKIVKRNTWKRKCRMICVYDSVHFMISH